MRSLRNCSFLIILGVFLCFAASLPADEPLDLLQPGSLAPVCELEGTDGQRHSFPASGSFSLVFYWSLFCHSCLDEIPAVQQRLASDGIEVPAFFVALDSKRMEKAIQNFCKKRKLSHPVLYEVLASDSYLTADQWGVEMTPSAFIVGSDRKVVWSHAGPMDIDVFFAELAKLQQKVNRSAISDEKKPDASTP